MLEVGRVDAIDTGTDALRPAILLFSVSQKGRDGNRERADDHHKMKSEKATNELLGACCAGKH